MLRILLVLSLLLVPGISHALPVVVGCCDSLTHQTDRTYMDLLNTNPSNPEFEWFNNPAIPSQTTGEAITTLSNFLATQPADAVVLLTGTPDTFFDPSGFQNRPYDQAETLGNIQTMITDVENSGAAAILASPLPAIDPCDDPVNLTCVTINQRLTDLSGALQTLAGTDGIPFVDLHSIFASYGQTALKTILKSDGLHPTHEYGDPIIANAIRPVLRQTLGPILDPVPEPSSLLLLTMGLVGVGLAARTRRATN